MQNIYSTRNEESVMEPLKKTCAQWPAPVLLTLLLFGSGFLPDRKEEDPLIPFRMMLISAGIADE